MVRARRLCALPALLGLLLLDQQSHRPAAAAPAGGGRSLAEHVAARARLDDGRSR